MNASRSVGFVTLKSVFPSAGASSAALTARRRFFSSCFSGSMNSTKFSNVAQERLYCGWDSLAVPPLAIASSCLSRQSAAIEPGSGVCS